MRCFFDCRMVENSLLGHEVVVFEYDPSNQADPEASNAHQYKSSNHRLVADKFIRHVRSFEIVGPFAVDKVVLN